MGKSNKDANLCDDTERLGLPKTMIMNIKYSDKETWAKMMDLHENGILAFIKLRDEFNTVRLEAYHMFCFLGDSKGKKKDEVLQVPMFAERWTAYGACSEWFLTNALSEDIRPKAMFAWLEYFKDFNRHFEKYNNEMEKLYA